MTYAWAKKDLPRLLRGGRDRSGARNEKLLVHAAQSFGVALCFVPALEGLTLIHSILDDASRAMKADGSPFCPAGKYPQWDTISKIANCEHGVSLEAACRMHLWFEAFIKYAPVEPRFVQAVEAVRALLESDKLPDNSFELCLNLLKGDASKNLRKSVSDKGGTAISDVHAFSAAIFADAPIEEAAKRNVILYLEEGEKGNRRERRDYRFSDETAEIMLAGYRKLAGDHNLPLPSKNDLFRYGGTEGKAYGRSTVALSTRNGNLIRREARA